MKKSNAVLSSLNNGDELSLSEIDSRLMEDEERKAFYDGINIANLAFGNFQDLLLKEASKRKK